MAPNEHLMEEHPWRSPDHPPYALMIGEAIEVLSDPGGAAPSAISDYITSNFNGLPPAHHKLFPFFLRKPADMKVFAEIFPGRFVIADPGSDDEPPHFVQYHGDLKPLAETLKRQPTINRELEQKTARRRGRPPKRDQGGFIQMPPLSRDSARKGNLVKRGRGRPPKRIQVEFQMPRLSFIFAPLGDSVKRGRGRPRKKAEEKPEFALPLEAR
ncbi:hypothetical protein KSP40_PGU020565 [Platanthera guangdongensis]|uniref:H15 domain-containing protein n=1 Tax=Platanthera guangdongensis TaxID=2320717 RepID=A0ABR2MND6_9ASPA